MNNYALVAAGVVTATWKSGGSTSISGPLAFAANGGIAAPGGSPETRWFETAVGEALVLNLGGAVAVGGHVTYTV